jgi:GDPmannose 4,6-dehydratase
MLNFLISLSKIKNIKIVEDPSRLRPIDADLQIPDTKKFMDATGWKPRISFQKTMTDLLNYWRKRVQNNNFLDR